MTPPTEIPLFPLGNPLFPGGRLHLRIFEPRYLEMTARCLADNSVFGVCLIEGGYEVGTPAIPAAIGCCARITESRQPAADQYLLATRGETRFEVTRRWTLPSGLIMANVRWIEPPDPVPLPDRYQPLAALLRQLADRLGDQAPLPTPYRLEDAAWVGYRWAELLDVTPERRQGWLEIDDPCVVLEQVRIELQRQSR
jgi:uncharacterized protein